MTEYVLELKNINKYFGKNHVIKNVSMNFKKGDFVTFLGPSGCGKTTILRMIAGFYEPDDGEILLNKRNIERVPPYARNAAMVFQEYALFPHMNVYENVSYGLSVKGMGKAEMDEKVKKALTLMQLQGMEARYPNQMSASSSAWQSPGRLSWIRKSCFWTNRCPIWMRSCGKAYVSNCGISNGR